MTDPNFKAHVEQLAAEGKVTLSGLTVKDHIQGEVEFQYYRDGSLWYRTSTAFMFPVPIEDIGNATFLARDKGILFMRYIRKQLASLAKVKAEFEFRGGQDDAECGITGDEA